MAFCRFAFLLCVTAALSIAGFGAVAGDSVPSVRFQTADGDVLALNRSTVGEARIKLGWKRERMIWMRLKPDAAKRLEIMTRENLGKGLSVIYNGRIVQRVVIRAVISAASSRRGLIIQVDEVSRSMLDAIKQ